QIQALFHEVADLPDPAQRASLEAQCAEDPTLMTEVLSLLEQDARGDSLLDRDAAHVAAEVLDEGIPPALLDQTFGPYRLKEALGQGGMGVVRSEEHTSELQSRGHVVCGLLFEKKKLLRAAGGTAGPAARRSPRRTGRSCTRTA